MHGHYKSRKKMLASTLHLTTTPADHHHHQQPGDSSDCPERHHHSPPPKGSRGRPLRTQQRADASHRVLSSTYSKKQPHPTTSPQREASCGPPPETWPPRAGHLMATSHTRNPRRSEAKLLRKEVIQPHLPVRLPCYDFVPIASPTFDRSPPCGLGHGLRVLPTFVT